MAEFQDVIRQNKRMCQSVKCCKCGIYRLCGEDLSKCQRFINNNPKKAEEVIMSWAAEHPEPVYPTWYEYLFNVTRGENKWPVDDHEFCQWLDTTRIPADIAQKLGIEPVPKAWRSVKEG